MKIKATEYNGALTVSVFGLGLQQELVICEDRGGFSFELRERKQPSQAKEVLKSSLLDEVGAVNAPPKTVQD